MTPSEIKPGMKFGHWTVLEYSGTNKHRIKYFLCECECGTKRKVRGTALIQGASRACCRQCDNNLVGQRFGKLTVVKRDKSRMGHWYCQCDCGSPLISLRGTSLRAEKIKSCGCLKGTRYKEHWTEKENKKYNEAIGKTFGHLTILRSYNEWYYWCRCKCGKELKVDKKNLLNGNSQSCGCKRAETYLTNKQKEYEEFIGTKINNLTIDRCYYKNNSFWFDCTCSCGKKFTGQATKVASGYYASCGCVKSRAEEEFEQILLKEGIHYKREYKFLDCCDKAPLPFDFAIFNSVDELVGVVELNGQQHYCVGGWSTKKHLEYVQKHDKMKCKFCCENDIPLLVIPFQYYDQLEEFLKTSDFWEIITKNFND